MWLNLLPEYRACYFSRVSPKKGHQRARKEKSQGSRLCGENPAWSPLWGGDSGEVGGDKGGAAAHRGAAILESPQLVPSLFTYLLCPPQFATENPEQYLFFLYSLYNCLSQETVSYLLQKLTLHLLTWYVHNDIPTYYCQAWFSRCPPLAKCLPTCVTIWDRWHSKPTSPSSHVYYERWNFHPRWLSCAVPGDGFALLLPWPSLDTGGLPSLIPILSFPAKQEKEAREEPQPKA